MNNDFDSSSRITRVGAMLNAVKQSVGAAKSQTNPKDEQTRPRTRGGGNAIWKLKTFRGASHTFCCLTFAGSPRLICIRFAIIESRQGLQETLLRWASLVLHFRLLCFYTYLYLWPPEQLQYSQPSKVFPGFAPQQDKCA